MAQNLETSSNTTISRFPIALGPIRLEIIHMVLNGSQTVDNPDTLTTRLQRPLAAFVKRVNADQGNAASTESATLSGKTLTIHDLAASRTYLVLVYGF